MVVAPAATSGLSVVVTIKELLSSMDAVLDYDGVDDGIFLFLSLLDMVVVGVFVSDVLGEANSVVLVLP